jgi:hypothetical protein
VTEVLLTASGLEVRQFIIQLTMAAVEADEPVRNLQRLENAGCEGIYLFTPDPTH